MSAPKGKHTVLTVPATMMRYGNIIFQDRPVHDGDVFSRKHPRMNRLNRAKIFAPFAALVGFEDRVQRKETAYVTRRELDADEEWELNHKLYELHRLTANSKQARANRIRIRIEYFELCPDEENDAYQIKGQYKTITGIVLNVDPHEQCIALRCDGAIQVIPFADIYRIDCLLG